MDEEFKIFESQIKVKHSFHWTPIYEDEIKTTLSKDAFVPVVLKIFEKLGWVLIHREDDKLEAFRTDSWDYYTEKIIVIFRNGKIKIKSSSVKNNFWDFGSNSKRVSLFIYAVQKIEKEYDDEARIKLIKELERADNLEDYEIPLSLPLPPKRKKSKDWIMIIGGLFFALLIGLIVAGISLNLGYALFLFEFAIGFLISLIIVELVKISNYDDLSNLIYFLISMIIIIFASNQYYQFLILLWKEDLGPIGFFEFIKQRFNATSSLEEVNYGKLKFIFLIAAQLGLTYLFGYIRLFSDLTNLLIDRIPKEVIDFTFYQFSQQKTEYEVRVELSKLGWKLKEDQNDVFNAIGTIYELKDLERNNYFDKK